jgi:hypothetical protein
MIAFAQEKKMSAGLGLEWNMDSRHNFAGGTLLSFDYKRQRFVSLGFFVAGSSNFSDTHVIEPAFVFRAYYKEYEFAGLFFQSELGISFIHEDGERWTLPLVGVGVGYRKLLGSLLYIEPYGRMGYPFAFGLGVIGGVRF